MEHSGIKIPFFAFFAHDSGKRVQEAPLNMLIAMGCAAALCVGLGVAYPQLYKILPFSMSGHPYHPFTTPHVVAQLQLLAFAALAFVFLIKFHLYPAEERATILDADWFYRKAAPRFLGVIGTAIQTFDQRLRGVFIALLSRGLNNLRSSFGEQGVLGSTWSTNVMAFWATLMLVVALLLNYLNMLR
jgi:multicomponent Na+:H+ antiporter subunit D